MYYNLICIFICTPICTIFYSCKKWVLQYNTSNITEGNLSLAHPTGLGLALNVSIFYYEMLDSPDRYVSVQLLVLYCM
jgi:hypothetical protein